MSESINRSLPFNLLLITPWRLVEVPHHFKIYPQQLKTCRQNTHTFWTNNRWQPHFHPSCLHPHQIPIDWRKNEMPPSWQRRSASCTWASPITNGWPKTLYFHPIYMRTTSMARLQKPEDKLPQEDFSETRRTLQNQRSFGPSDLPTKITRNVVNPQCFSCHLTQTIHQKWNTWK